MGLSAQGAAELSHSLRCLVPDLCVRWHCLCRFVGRVAMVSQDIQAPIWIFVCVLKPLVGIGNASRMFLLSLLPGGMRERFRQHF